MSRMHLELYDSVGDGMKGLLTSDHSVIAWEVDDEGNPHHDEVAEDRGISHVAQMTHGRNNLNVSADGSPFGPTAREAVSAFTAFSPGDSLTIESEYRMLITTMGDYWSQARKSPDPGDYEDGADDTQFKEDTTAYIDALMDHITVSQVLGRGGVEDAWEEGRLTVYNPPPSSPLSGYAVKRYSTSKNVYAVEFEEQEDIAFTGRLPKLRIDYMVSSIRNMARKTSWDVDMMAWAFDLNKTGEPLRDLADIRMAVVLHITKFTGLGRADPIDDDSVMAALLEFIELEVALHGVTIVALPTHLYDGVDLRSIEAHGYTRRPVSPYLSAHVKSLTGASS